MPLSLTSTCAERINCAWIVLRDLELHLVPRQARQCVARDRTERGRARTLPRTERYGACLLHTIQSASLPLLLTA